MQKKFQECANVNVDVVWDPPWTMDKLSDDAKETLKKMGTGGRIIHSSSM